jgi:hypothetical protein
VPTLKNARHEVFAQEVAKGKSNTEAYEIAGYRDGKKNAHRLGTDKGILGRVNEILAEREYIHGQATADAIKAAALTKEWVIEMLTQNVAKAMQAKAVLNDDGEPIGEYSYQGSVANRALELLGKELGMFIDRKEVTLENKRDAADWNRAELVAILNDSRPSREGAAETGGRSGKLDRVH